MPPTTPPDHHSARAPDDADRWRALAKQIKQWGLELGFQQIGIADIELTEHERHLQRWLEEGFHGEMEWMGRYGNKRSRPDQLVPGTQRVICARMDYLPPGASAQESFSALEENSTSEQAMVSRYTRGRDYHKVIRARLARLAKRIEDAAGPFGYRVFTDSAPVMEKALAEKAGLGWIGKHSNLLNREAGSWFFLGEIYTDLPLPTDAPASEHCGGCVRCIDACPTGAIVAPYRVDARRCISYLTIELKGAIPEEFRVAMGNRIFGCDDCQAVCPWNRFADFTAEQDFHPRHGLDDAALVDLFAWSEQTFEAKTAGSAIRRTGYLGWLRNIAVALGNAPSSESVIAALRARAGHPSDMVREHVAWALRQHGEPYQ